ncbi:MAG: thioredoxin [Asgard group archaeon]|nr:thioredoxin [Asgard group archaeon]
MTQENELKSENGNIKELTTEKVREFLNNNEQAIIALYSPTCPPCKRMQIFVEELANKFNGEVAFAKLNAKEDQEAVKKFRIMAFPTYYFFHKGVPVAHFMGEKKKKDFEYLMKIHFRSLKEK